MDSSKSITSDESENEIEIEDDSQSSSQSVSKSKEISKSANSSSKATSSSESSASSIEKQVGDKGITWVIKNFSSLKDARIYSDQFVVGGCKWRLQAYRMRTEKADRLSMYLEVPDKDSLPIGWKRHARFSLTVVNQFKLSLRKDDRQHLFDQKSTRWWYPGMLTHAELNSEEGFLMNGDLIVVAMIDLLEVVGKSNISEKSSPVIGSVDVNGFQVLPSQVASVKRLFEIHPDIASNIRRKNPYLKTAYMNVLLNLTQTLCQSPQELSNDDISDADGALAYLRTAGFKMDWLKKKADELKKKKKKEEVSLAQLRVLEEKLKPRKKQCLDLEAQIDDKKTELLAARAPLSLYEDK